MTRVSNDNTTKPTELVIIDSSVRYPPSIGRMAKGLYYLVDGMLKNVADVTGLSDIQKYYDDRVIRINKFTRYG